MPVAMASAAVSLLRITPTATAQQHALPAREIWPRAVPVCRGHWRRWDWGWHCRGDRQRFRQLRHVVVGDDRGPGDRQFRPGRPSRVGSERGQCLRWRRLGRRPAAALRSFGQSDILLNEALSVLFGNGEGAGGGLYAATGAVVTLHKSTVAQNLASTSNNNIDGTVIYE